MGLPVPCRPQNSKVFCPSADKPNYISFSREDCDLGKALPPYQMLVRHRANHIVQMKYLSQYFWLQKRCWRWPSCCGVTKCNSLRKGSCKLSIQIQTCANHISRKQYPLLAALLGCTFLHSECAERPGLPVWEARARLRGDSSQPQPEPITPTNIWKRIPALNGGS